MGGLCSPVLILFSLFHVFTLIHAQPDEYLRYRVKENARPGTKIADIATESGLRKRYPTDVLERLEYSFLSPPSIPVSIGRNTGVLRTSGDIDRDVIKSCRRKPSCDISIDAAVQPVEYFRIIKVLVEIVDVNDNPPRFTDSNPVLSILESATVGSSFLLPSAVDADASEYGIVRYELQQDEPRMFGLKQTKKLDGFIDVRLQLEEKLDRELVDHYHLKLAVFDGGNPPLTDTINITVRVLDANDNDPVFEHTTYDVTIVENSPLYTEVVSVHASDRDIEENGRVRYGFTAQTEALYDRLFDINTTTGWIYVRGHIDREIADTYQLIVTAEDSGLDSHPTDVTVTVHVADLNDNKPLIRVNSLVVVGGDFARVPENVPPGTFVAHVTVLDPDLGSNGTVDCSLLQDFGNFRLVRRPLSHESDTEYQILTERSLDREERDSYNISLTCSDEGTPAQTSVRYVQVSVTDDNDNDPQFSKSLYTVRASENNIIGARLAQVFANDLDQGNNAHLKYTLDSGVSQFFNIDQGGYITAKLTLDRETRAEYRFRVLVSDSGNFSRTSSATVEIEVEDINDERPVFSPPSYMFTLVENEPKGTTVGQVRALDADIPPYNGVVKYNFIQHNIATDGFEINADTGVITTRRPFDREGQSTFYLPVAAIDLGDPPLTGSTTVIVRVEDVNDNSPVFEFPTQTNHTVTVSNKINPGHIVAILRARDPDEDSNGRVTYRDITNGVVSSSVHDSSLDKYHERSDIGNSESGDVIANRNSSGGISSSASEFVGHHQSTRSVSDQGLSNMLEKNSNSESAAFRVDPVSGAVFANKHLIDIENQVFRLFVMALDGGHPERNATAILDIIVDSTAQHWGDNQDPASGTMLATRSIRWAIVSGGIILLVLLVLLIICSAFLVSRAALRKNKNNPARHGHVANLSLDCSVNEGLKMLTSREIGSSPECSPTKTPSKSALIYTGPASGVDLLNKDLKVRNERVKDFPSDLSSPILCHIQQSPYTFDPSKVAPFTLSTPPIYSLHSDIPWKERSPLEDPGKHLLSPSTGSTELPYCTMRQKRSTNPVYSSIISTPNPWTRDSPPVTDTRKLPTGLEINPQISTSSPFSSCRKAPSESQLRSLTLPGPAKFRHYGDPISYGFTAAQQYSNTAAVTNGETSSGSHDNRRHGSSGYYSDSVTHTPLSTFNTKPLFSRHSVDYETGVKDLGAELSGKDDIQGTTVLKNTGILRNSANKATNRSAPCKQVQTRYSTSTVIV